MAHILGGNITPALTQSIKRLEELLGRKKAITEDIAEVYREAKSKGLDVAALREIIKLRKLDQAEREERELIRDVYLRALGLIDTVGEK